MLERIKPITGLVNEMLDALPVELWTSKTTTFFDPAIGGGQFVREIERRLRVVGHSDANIHSRVFGFEYSMALVDMAINMNKLVGQYSKMPYAQFFEWKPNMKFDVIVGNPPYQSAGTQGKKLWKEFFIKFSELLATDGFMGILTPSSYVKRDGRRMADVRAVVESNTVHYLDMDASIYFNVGEDICGIVMQQGKHPIKTSVKYNKKIELQDLTKSFDPVFGAADLIKRSIFHKLQSTTDPKLPIREDINNSQAKLITQGILSITKDKSYKYPVIYTPNTTHYAKKQFKDGGKLRLMLTIAGTYYNKETPNRNIFVTKAQSGQGMCHILIPSKIAGERIKSYLTSKLYQFYINNEKTSGYNTGLKNLPYLGIRKKWTDAQLYEHFGLTQEEIDYVEASVK